MAPWSKKNLGVNYSKAMDAFNHGYAFYDFPDTDQVRVGSLGFIDNTGSWNLIAHLLDSDSLEENGLTEFQHKVKVTKTFPTWGPRATSDVEDYHGKLDASADVSLPGAAVITETLGGVASAVTAAKEGFKEIANAAKADGKATDAPPLQNDVGGPDGQTEPPANDEEGNTDTITEEVTNEETTELRLVVNKAQRTYAPATVTNSGVLQRLKIETTRTLTALIYPPISVHVASRLQAEDEAGDDAADEPQNDVPKVEDAAGDDAAGDDAAGDDAADEPQNDVPKVEDAAGDDAMLEPQRDVEGPAAAEKASAATKVLMEEAAGFEKAAEAATKANKTAPGKKDSLLPGATATINFGLKKKASFGVVLLTESPNTVSIGTIPKEACKMWMDQNKEQLKIYKNELREFGLLIITTVISTDSVAQAILDKETQEVSMGFGVTAAMAGQKIDLKPTGSYLTASASDAWKTQSAEGDKQPVIFVNGIYFKNNAILPNKVTRGISRLQVSEGDDETKGDHVHLDGIVLQEGSFRNLVRGVH